MGSLRKKVFVAAGSTSLFFGPGRKEFDPSKPMSSFETYLLSTAKGSFDQIPQPEFDEGVIGSFMAARFLNQANLPGFLPFMAPSLKGKPCIGVEGACGTGGRVIGVAVRSILSDLSGKVFACGFEVQNSVKSVYGADILAGAGYYQGMRKKGHAFFFPNVFSKRAGAYFERYGKETTRKAMAKWYETAILNARRHCLSQEYHNEVKDLMALGMTSPDPNAFLEHLNLFDCSKVTDGAASCVIASSEGLKQMGIEKANALEIVGLGEAEGDITQEASDLTALEQTKIAAKQALLQAGISIKEIGMLEVHDCFTITGLLSLEAIGLCPPGKAPEYILNGGLIPINSSGGLIGFGHPTGASGVRMLVDLQQKLKAQSKSSYGMMISMGGDDKTVTAIIVKSI